VSAPLDPAAAGVAARRREEYYARVAALAGTSGRRDTVRAVGGAHGAAFDSADAQPAAYVSALA
jgi:hypothetical protein